MNEGLKINRIPDWYDIEVQDDEASDATLRFSLEDGKLKVFLKSGKAAPRIVRLRWNTRIPAGLRILGDEWERAYGEMQFHGIHVEKCMPWYFAAVDGKKTTCCGIMVRPNALVSFAVDGAGITAWCDVRCGARGVLLGDRELEVAEFVAKEYDVKPIDALTDFCHIMSPDPILPKAPVYGGNNWYYAYGNSSYDEIVNDCRLQAELAEGLENRPFMVIDDGWQPNRCAGPWVANERYGDMKKVADEFKKMDVHPGIWVRFLRDDRKDVIPDSWRTERDGERLDPSVPEVLDLISTDVRRIVHEWGFELIKHDFSAMDTFGAWGSRRNGLYATGDWSFYRKDLTSAEIYKNFCKCILDATEGKAYILGCNCVTHLTAGYCHINRTGDDTSGRSWDRTRKMGVNTLAFRMPQNRALYMSDADCVGIIPGMIDWKLNSQWAKLLAYSGTPMFISCARGTLTDEQFSYLKELYAVASKQQDVTYALDWEDTTTPSEWSINGKQESFCWYDVSGSDFRK